MSEWIPVTDELPNESRDLYPFKADILFRVGQDWRSGTFQHGKFVACSGSVISNVTHWMPLPTVREKIRKGSKR